MACSPRRGPRAFTAARPRRPPSEPGHAQLGARAATRVAAAGDPSRYSGCHGLSKPASTWSRPRRRAHRPGTSTALGLPQRQFALRSAASCQQHLEMAKACGWSVARIYATDTAPAWTVPLGPGRPALRGHCCSCWCTDLNRERRRDWRPRCGAVADRRTDVRGSGVQSPARPVARPACRGATHPVAGGGARSTIGCCSRSAPAWRDSPVADWATRPFRGSGPCNH
jgi:hypothetical protein